MCMYNKQNTDITHITNVHVHTSIYIQKGGGDPAVIHDHPTLYTPWVLCVRDGELFTSSNSSSAAPSYLLRRALTQTTLHSTPTQESKHTHGKHAALNGCYVVVRESRSRCIYVLHTFAAWRCFAQINASYTQRFRFHHHLQNVYPNAVYVCVCLR